MFKETPRLKNELSSLPKAQALGYTARKPKGPVLQNTIGSEVAAPTYKRGFVTPKFRGLVRLAASSRMVTGGMGISAKTAARLNPCFEHPVHLLRFKTQTVASLSRSGAKTMTATLRAHTAAPTSPQANKAQEAIAAHIGVHNCLSMAAWHIAKGNTPAAARKVRQALAALRQLDKLEA